MKTILLALMFLGIVSPCHGKARYAQKKDMIREAECIAVVNITKVEESVTVHGFLSGRQERSLKYLR